MAHFTTRLSPPTSRLVTSADLSCGVTRRRAPPTCLCLGGTTSVCRRGRRGRETSQLMTSPANRAFTHQEAPKTRPWGLLVLTWTRAHDVTVERCGLLRRRVGERVERKVCGLTSYSEGAHFRDGCRKPATASPPSRPLQRWWFEYQAASWANADRDGRRILLASKQARSSLVRAMLLLET